MRMEKKNEEEKGEKMKRENFLEGIWLREKEREGKMMVRPTWTHQKVFLPK